MAREENNERTTQDAIVQSLCQLHQQALQEDLKGFTAILEDAIDSTLLVEEQYKLSAVTRIQLRKYAILKGFAGLDKKQRKKFLKLIEDSDETVTDSFS